MEFGVMRVGTYLLHSRVCAPGAGPGTLMELRRHSEDTGPVDDALVYFSDKPAEGSLSEGALVAHLHEREFDLWYQALQTTAPVWLGWSATVTGSGLSLVGVFTGIGPLDEAASPVQVADLLSA